MADLQWSSFLSKLMSKRRTWVTLFLIVYILLLSSSWNLIISIRSWYNASISPSTQRPNPSIWPTIYASLLYGGVFGLLAMGAALAVAVPATLVTWITVLVLLAFTGKPRRALVREGRRITADIMGFAFMVLIREGNLAAAVCAALSFFALLIRRRGEDERGI
ncbi:uncharacterized protein LOC120270695 [Dioscorea cayenensis subsp. rotundata]|uniref:Uncharacterized protein LOC120270695 n=1 Tax=Dioscorea cayennensis subsp. rotundata TaxID=55577 RepID=A0AB40C1S4_DIOCR|nr:uncharacterized protein LOC120270695 [Dioscorea cayenensis subsp. rotundata]